MPGWLGSILPEVASLSEGSGPEHVKNSPGFGHHLTLTTQFVGLKLGSPGQRKRQEAVGVRRPWLWVLCPGFCSLSALLVCLMRSHAYAISFDPHRPGRSAVYFILQRGTESLPRCWVAPCADMHSPRTSHHLMETQSAGSDGLVPPQITQVLGHWFEPLPTFLKSCCIYTFPSWKKAMMNVVPTRKAMGCIFLALKSWVWMIELIVNGLINQAKSV